ncbi:MAG TPA: YggS family pyridoxal phosphate-dependent enzyme [Trebonia sp.]|nr:YggS family pyridoxal phosphate-dependent enzyme [Trebonia sp.]
MTTARRAELADNLAATRARIAAACAAAGRDVSEITLIAVTKTRPATDVAALADLGLADFGENKDQEAAPKAAAVAEATSLPVRWHFIGQLQTNKAHSVVRYASVVHSVDRLRLVRALGAASRAAATAATAATAAAETSTGPSAAPTAAGAPVSCLVQVSLDGDPSRGGALISQLPEIAAAIEAEEGLTLGGVMAVAPLGVPPETAFAELGPISNTVREINPAATVISAGMTGDLEAAVRHGATHLRIGTALLGNRSLPLL